MLGSIIIVGCGLHQPQFAQKLRVYAWVYMATLGCFLQKYPQLLGLYVLYDLYVLMNGKIQPKLIQQADNRARPWSFFKIRRTFRRRSTASWEDFAKAREGPT